MKFCSLKFHICPRGIAFLSKVCFSYLLYTGLYVAVPKNPHYEIPRRYALAPTIFDSGFIDVDVNESGRSSPVFSLPGVLKVMDSVLGLNDRASKLVLLKMRREERVAPKEEKRQDDTVQQLYTFEDLLEVLFHFPVFKEILQRVASEVPMSSKELLLNLQGHLRSPASGIENKSSTVIQGQGLPVRKSQRELKGTKAKLSEYLKDLIQKTKSPSSSPSENVRPLAGHLEKLLSLCVTLKVTSHNTLYVGYNMFEQSLLGLDFLYCVKGNAASKLI